jgi:hypothetical protein
MLKQEVERDDGSKKSHPALLAKQGREAYRGVAVT